MKDYSDFPGWVEQIASLVHEKPGFIVREGGPYRTLFEAGVLPIEATRVMKRVRRTFILRSINWVASCLAMLANLGFGVVGMGNLLRTGWPDGGTSMVILYLLGLLVSFGAVVIFTQHLKAVGDVKSFIRPGTAKFEVRRR